MVASYLFLGGYLVINYHDICQTYDIFGDKLSFNNEKIRIRISFPIYLYTEVLLWKNCCFKNLNQEPQCGAWLKQAAWIKFLLPFKLKNRRW